MGKIIKFQTISLEDKFMKSLTDEQNEMFYEILTKIQADYEDLQARHIKKIAECEILRLENKCLKGEKRVKITPEKYGKRVKGA